MLQRLDRVITTLYNQQARLHIHAGKVRGSAKGFEADFGKCIAARGKCSPTFGRADSGAPHPFAQRPPTGGRGG